jgi:hypothetical protein
MWAFADHAVEGLMIRRRDFIAGLRAAVTIPHGKLRLVISVWRQWQRAK